MCYGYSGKKIDLHQEEQLANLSRSFLPFVKFVHLFASTFSATHYGRWCLSVKDDVFVFLQMCLNVTHPVFATAFSYIDKESRLCNRTIQNS